MENQPIKCPNQSCGKVFTNPLRTTNLDSRNSRSYDACPYCLTEIAVEENSTSAVVDSVPDVRVSEAKKEEHLAFKGEKPSAPSSKPSACPHHLGYLSKRSPKEKIPEDCMVCENIVECMLKAVTG